jgi:hypothetical protein
MDEERAPSPLAPTGDARVDQAVEGLCDLDQIDLDDRPAVLEEVHDRLREILGELSEPGRPVPARPGERGQQGELGRSRPPYAG